VRDDHVDPRLRVRVEPAADPERERGIEVRDLDLDVQDGVAVGPDAPALDVDLEMAAPASLA